MEERPPFELSHAFPTTCNDGKERLERLLNEGCSCGGENATLTRRTLRSGVQVVALQCDNCGSAKMAGLRRVDFPAFDSFDPFDAEFQDRHWRERYAQESKQVREKREAEQIEWAQQYEQFLRTREWYELRLRVIQRDGYCCQACGAIKNQHQLRVHHLSYEFGFTPPLWLLQTVCIECHDRLHADKHGFADPWCPKSMGDSNLMSFSNL